MAEITLRVEGMSCGHCVASVRETMLAVPGVVAADVSLEHGRAVVQADPSVRVEDLLSAFLDSDFRVSEDSSPPAAPPPPARVESPEVPHEPAARADLRLSIEGMTCASCVGRVERALSGVVGVERASVNFATERASLQLSGGVPGSEVAKAARAAVEAAGYHAAVVDAPDSPPRDSMAAREQDARNWRRRFIVGAALSVPIVVVEMGAHWFGHTFHVPGGDVAAFVLATIVVALLGGRFIAGAARALRHGQFTMDTLVALGVSAAYGHSAIFAIGGWTGILDKGGPVYFESAAVVLTLVSLGKWLEARARLRAGEAIRALMELGAKSAVVERAGTEVEVPIAALVPGDVMIVRPGGKVPTDGVVVSGKSNVDESLITGESMPVAKEPGMGVTGSTINLDGLIRVRATATGEHTALSRIVRMVERAQEGKASVQRLADRVANVFVPAVLFIAMLTLLAWGIVGGGWERGLWSAVAVLIVACPCALGLATPAALMVGTGRGARQGILIRDVAAIEGAGRIDVVVLDKTGTVTQGKPSVTEILPLLPEVSPDILLRTAARVEAGSEHPLARAIVARAVETGGILEPARDFRSHAGLGVQGDVDGVRIAVGSREFIAGRGLDSAPASALIAKLEESAQSVVLVADETSGKLLGILGVADPLKPSSAAAISRLGAGLLTEVWLMTGDNAPTAAAIAREAGIPPSRVLAGVRPEGKADAVRALQAKGRRVAMVGDGVNDAPALAQADLGIAMGTGTDVAMEAGAITLMSGDLAGVGRAIRLSRATMAKIRQNLAWAFIYNIVLIPVAASGYLSPMLAGLAMALSSVSVVGNSLLLNRVDLDRD